MPRYDVKMACASGGHSHVAARQSQHPETSLLTPDQARIQTKSVVASVATIGSPVSPAPQKFPHNFHRLRSRWPRRWKRWSSSLQEPGSKMPKDAYSVGLGDNLCLQAVDHVKRSSNLGRRTPSWTADSRV